MKNYYHVSFKYSENIFCANIAHAESEDDVRRYYSDKYDWIAVSAASPLVVEGAKNKGMPFVEVPHKERLGTLARDVMNLFFDIDPWNGASEEEIMESVVNDITEDPSAVFDDLQGVIDDETLEEYHETAEKLKKRVTSYICR